MLQIKAILKLIMQTVWNLAKACFLEQEYVLQSQIFLKGLYIFYTPSPETDSFCVFQQTNHMTTSEDLLQFVKDDT